MNKRTKKSSNYNSDSKYMFILLLSFFLTTLISGIALIFGFFLHAAFMMIITVPFFIVAFATAPLFSKIRIQWETRGAMLGAILAWVSSAPLGALINTIMNKASGISDPYEFLPVTWLLALVPLTIVTIVSITVTNSNKLSKSSKEEV